MPKMSFLSAIADAGDKAALVFQSGRVVTYAELHRRMSRFAEGLPKDHKVLVAIAAEASEHAIIAYLATLRAGHAAIMLPPCDRDVWEDVEARYAPDYLYRRVGDRWHLQAVAPWRDRVAPETDRAALHPDLALLLMTSGSSGKAKGVRLSHGNLDANAQAIAASLDLVASDRAALILPLHYSYGLSVLNSHLAVGASLFFPGVGAHEADFAERLREAGVTNLAGVPYTYELLEASGFRSRHHDLRFMTVAGGRLSPDLIRIYRDHLRQKGASFFVMYGQTEATARMAVVPPDALADHEERIGLAIPGGTLAVVDGVGRDVPPGTTGELVYRGPNVMMGYAESRQDLAQGRSLEELRTGDLATCDGDGMFRIVGRLSRFAKIAGLRIGFDALEASLAKAGISAAVTGDDTGLHAAVVGAGDADRAREILVRESRLSGVMVTVEVVDALPRLSSGKIDYSVLKAGMRSARARACRRAGSVREAFARVFYPARVGEKDSFVSLGGDSLRFLQLAIEFERTGLQVPSGWETVSVADLEVRRTPGDVASPLRLQAGRRIGMDMVLRALAIVTIVVHHEMLWPIPGGSAIMMMLVGFSLARFQSTHFTEGRFVAALRPAVKVLVPYYLIVAAYALAWKTIPWASVSLTGNFGYALPERYEMLPYLYWFVEAYVQTLVVFLAVFAIPTVRRVAKHHLFGFSLVLLVLSLIGFHTLPPLYQSIGNRQIFTLPWVLPLALFGWCGALATTARQRALLLLIAALFFGHLVFINGVWIGTKIKYASVFAAFALLLLKPMLTMPDRLVRIVLVLSASAFPIYLLHRFVPELLLEPWLGMLSAPMAHMLSIAGGLGLGILVNAAVAGLRNGLAEAKGRRLEAAASV